MLAYLAVAARGMLVVVFAVSSVSKVRSRSSFTDFVASLRAMGQPVAGLAGPLAAGVVAAELSAVVLLAVPATARLGLAAAAAVLVVFSLGIEHAVRRGRTVRCRCFGSASTPLSRAHVMRNLLLAGAAGGALCIGPHDAGQPVAIGLALFSGAIAAIVLIRFDELADLFVSPRRPRAADRR